MRIKLTSILVDNQDKALKFYTEIFGFVKKVELPAGEPNGSCHGRGVCGHLRQPDSALPATGMKPK